MEKLPMMVFGLDPELSEAYPRPAMTSRISEDIFRVSELRPCDNLFSPLDFIDTDDDFISPAGMPDGVLHL